MKPRNIGPWPEGVDSFNDVNSNVMQPRQRDPRKPGTVARLVTADNVDLDAEGWPEVRAGTTELTSATAGLNAASAAGLLLIQDGATVSTVDPDTGDKTAKIIHPSSTLKVQMLEQAGKVFCSNGTTHSVISAAGVASNWGMEVPPAPTLGTTAGDLPAGRYRVSCLLVDSTGAYSGAPEASTIEVDGTEDITVDLSSADDNAVYVRVYASFTNASNLYYVDQVAVGDLPTTITDVNVSSEILQTRFLVGPQAIAGVAGIGTWRGMMLLWRGKRVIHSFGNAHHLFDTRSAVWKFPSTVRAVAGAEDFCWIATDRGMFTYQGIGAKGRKSDPIGRRAYAAGSATVDASEIPMLGEMHGRVAVFASEDGIAMGLPDGRLLHPQHGRVRWDVRGLEASIAYRKIAGKMQFVTNLE